MSKAAKKKPIADAVHRWNEEFAAARKDVKKWHARGAKIVKRFKDERPEGTHTKTRWNLFSSNVQTQMALLYGQVPKVDVARRFSDAKDDVGRVAGIILERCLNGDIEGPTDTFAQAEGHALQDRMLPGMGMSRIRYEREERPLEPEEGAEPVELAEGEEEPMELVKECVVVDYVPWTDHLWSPSKVMADVRWWAFKAQLGKKQLKARFGDAMGELVPLNSGKRKDAGGEEVAKETPWGRADVWEIWSKEDKKVYWYVEGFDRLLDEKDDPLGLAGFWPFARPMSANATTDSLVPTPDFVLAQDLYDEVDDLSSRIKLLQEAIAVRGVYDGTNQGLQRLLSETAANELVPVANFATLIEKGGIAAAIAWLPLDIIVQALEVLTRVRLESKQALYEITGMSDIMRGQAGEAGVTATEQKLKAQFGSVRMQKLQGEFARHASDTQQLKAEVMSLFYAPETLLELSNIMQTADADFAQDAIALIKSKFGLYRVEVKPESVSMADFAAQRSEATEFVTGIATFMQAAAPLVEAVPGSTEALLELLGLVMARFHGFGDQAEGIIDKAIAELKAMKAQQAANPQPPPADPKLQAAQLKAQTDLQKVNLEHQADMERIAAETQAEASKQQQQAIFNVQEMQAQASIDVKAAHAMPKPPAPKGAKK